YRGRARARARPHDRLREPATGRVSARGGGPGFRVVSGTTTPAGAGRDPELASDGVGRNTAFAFAAQLTSAAFTAVITLYLVRALGPGGYGVFALAVGIGALLVLASDLGLTQSAERFIAEHRGDRAAVAGVLADTLKLKLGAAVLACGGLIALASPIADAYDSPALAWPLRAIALAVLGQTTM